MSKVGRTAPTKYPLSRATSETTRTSMTPYRPRRTASRTRRTTASAKATPARYVAAAQFQGSGGYQTQYRPVPRQAQRGYAAPPSSRRIHSSSRSRSYYQDGPSFAGPGEFEPEVVDPEFAYDSQYFGYGKGYGEGYGEGYGFNGGWGDGFESCDECHSPYPLHSPGCGGYCNWWWLENLTVFGGPHGFKGPADGGVNGNFGLGIGVNWGGPAWQAHSIGYQVGWQAVLSNFEGDQVAGRSSNDDREQHFITAGIFHRPLYRPVQWGVVVDWMSDDYLVEQTLSQIRAEISLLGPYHNEIGFWAAASTGTDSATSRVEIDGGSGNETMIVEQTIRSEPTDLYAFFWRQRFCTGIEGRIWGGFTGNSDGLFGADMRAPISPEFAVQAGFNYLAPNEDSAAGGQREEAWGLVMNLVWYPGHSAIQVTRSPWRPLFNVADNSVFMVDQTTQ